MPCDRHYFTFPQHLNQDLDMQANLKIILPSCESRALLSANGTASEGSPLNVACVGSGQVDVITRIHLGPQ